MPRPRPDAVLPPPVPGVLADGTEIRFLPITPAHRERLRRGFEQASPQSRYRRFLTPLNRLTEDQLDYLTNVDFVDHVAWGVETLPDETGVAIGRWIRLKDDPEVAEVAVAVLDRYQRQGIATALLQLLARSARERGVQALRAEVLADNEAVRGLLEKLGGVEILPAGNLLQVTARI